MAAEGSDKSRIEAVVYESLVKRLKIVNGKKDDQKVKILWQGSLEALKDMVSLILNRTGEWTHRTGSGSSISAHVFKSGGLTITWYNSTKTLQLQGNETEQCLIQIQELVKEHQKNSNTTENDANSSIDTYSSDEDMLVNVSQQAIEREKSTLISPRNTGNDTDYKTEINNIWSAINTLFNRNIETGKFFISLITEERCEKQKLQAELKAKSQEIEKLKNELVIVRLTNESISPQDKNKDETTSWSRPKKTCKQSITSPNLATPTSNRFQILENNGEICNSDKSSYPEGNSAFQIELENVKLRRKVHYLENQLSQNNKQLSQATNTRKAAKSENDRKVEDHTEQVKYRPLLHWGTENTIGSQSSISEKTSESQSNTAAKDPTELDQKSLKHEKKSGKSVTNNSSKLKRNNVIIVGDSILNNIDEKLLTTKNKYVKVYALSGATTTELVAFLRPLANTKPGKMIIHCGTNDLCDCTPDNVVDNLLNIKAVINSISPETVVIFSNLTLRTDSDSLAEKAKRVNSKLEEVCKRDNIFIVDNSNIDKRGLSAKGLHLNRSGEARLAMNFKAKLRSI